VSLNLEHASYSYRIGRNLSVDALRDVSFSVEPGELVLVLGATGSGKSTLMRICAGLLQLEQGQATLDGEPLVSATARGTVGLVFQDAESQLFADTLLEDVEFGPRNLGAEAKQARKVAERALSEVGLPPAIYGDRSPFSLSGGEARRVAIAGVIAMAPRYLLADEPTAGLDASGRASVRALLAQARAHAGVVVVTHAAEEFLGMADRVVMLCRGEVAWSGTAADAACPEAFTVAELRMPEVLEVQYLLSQCGVRLPGFTFDPLEAAERIAIAVRGGSKA
jgi:energy-coupling factor transport system ATP-binding protein